MPHALAGDHPIPTAENILSALPGRKSGCMARCPAHDDTTASLHVTQGGDRVLLRCFAGCSQESVIEALRRLGEWPDRPTAAAVERSWKCIDPISGEARTHYRKDAPGEPKRCWWSKDGPKPRRLLYTARATGEGPLVVCEGEVAADACARLGLDAIGTVTGAGHTPDADVLRAVTKDRDVLLWPDADDVGRGHMERIAQLGLGASVAVVDPALLGLTAAGADAADWRFEVAPIPWTG